MLQGVDGVGDSVSALGVEDVVVDARPVVVDSDAAAGAGGGLVLLVFPLEVARLLVVLHHLELVGVLELAAVVAVHAVGEAEPALDLTLREGALDDLHGDVVKLLVALGLLLHVIRDALALDGVDILPVGLVDGRSLERFDFLGHLGLFKRDVGVDYGY